MNILVTGSSGFLGRTVARHLSAHHKVIPFDAAHGQRLEHIADAIATERPDVVCHLAAIGDVYECQRDPERAAQVNVGGTASVIEACVKHGARLVHASTWEVMHPEEPYALTKAAAENMLLWACKHRGLNGIALRLGSAYGHGMRPSQVIQKFIGMAREGKSLTIHGDGSQFRQWTHSEDIAEAFRLAAECSASGALPVVGEEAVTIRELAERIAHRYGVGCTFGDARPADVPPEMVSTEETRRVLGWAPHVRFAEGLGELMP
jgi:UDP-glucose 4-epimerase